MRALPSANVRRGAAPVILVYHHVSDTPCRFTDLLDVTTHPDIFRRHVRHFARNYDLIEPDDLLADKLPSRPLLITFDDAYRSVLDVAGAILQEYQMASIFFINPGVIVGDNLPLDNLLCFAMHEIGAAGLQELMGQPVNAMTDAVLHAASRLNPRQREDLVARVNSRLGTSSGALREAAGIFLRPTDVPRMTQYGIVPGNHSLSHPFLRGLSGAALEHEICGAKVLIEQLSGQSVDWLSIPYGDARDATPSVLNVARNCGHRGVFLVQGQPNRTRPAPDVFFRVSPRNTPAALLPASLHLLPFLRMIRRRILPLLQNPKTAISL